MQGQGRVQARVLGHRLDHVRDRGRGRVPALFRGLSAQGLFRVHGLAHGLFLVLGPGNARGPDHAAASRVNIPAGFLIMSKALALAEAGGKALRTWTSARAGSWSSASTRPGTRTCTGTWSGPRPRTCAHGRGQVQVGP